MKAIRISFFVTVLAVTALLTNGCSKYNTDGGVGGCEISAKIGATSLCGTGYFTQSSSSAEIGIAASDKDNNSVIIISLPDGTIGSHALGGDGAGLSYTDGKGVIVATTGTVKVTKLSATLIKGTFSGTAQSIGDSTLITISDGSFSLKKLGL